ncbi:MAG: hypothetical protein VX987_02295 [Pseudomonadota bacterium]|nr:hypothetical protein [Pseudomonadota bacterium]
MKDFEMLRIDEAILPFMNGDSLSDIPQQFSEAMAVEVTIDGIIYQQEIARSSSWLDIFTAFDLALVKSNSSRRFDLAGVTQRRTVLSGIWL